MALIAYREALNQALREEMRRDPDVFLMGEEVGAYQGAYKISQGLLEEFGEWRVRDVPIAELGFTGLGVGAAMVGLRPVIEFMTWSFALLAIDGIVNAAAKMRYMSGGQFKIPITFRGPSGAANQLAATHSQALEAWYAHVPGLKVVAPATARDAKGLLKTAIRDDDPVVFLEGEILYATKDEVPEDDEFLLPLGVAEVKRPGKDVTVVAHSRPLHTALRAAETLEREDGISVEVIDPRTLRPMDVDSILDSVRRTNRCVIVEEGWPVCGIGAQIVDDIQREAFDFLDAPIARVTGADAPQPYARNLEQLAFPQAEYVVRAVRQVCYRG
ncbi:MAG: pyruvate dehydrogenase complex E1 component subunit beta [Gemmatimonadota bacterium]|nr:MAG: pyruvate dehydrogenase complex E1 component subunit beta [Gemmatimonadota bacterium]